MNEEKIKYYFTIIDDSVKVFNADKHFEIVNSQTGGWLVFDQRLMRRTDNGLNYMMQIFPHFDDNEKITSWTLYGAVSFDTLTDRYLTSFSPASKVPLEYIVWNTPRFLNETYNYICSVKKEDIPHAVELTKY